jgi:hypothetical protein
VEANKETQNREIGPLIKTAYQTKEVPKALYSHFNQYGTWEEKTLPTTCTKLLTSQEKNWLTTLKIPPEALLEKHNNQSICLSSYFDQSASPLEIPYTKIQGGIETNSTSLNAPYLQTVGAGLHAPQCQELNIPQLETIQGNFTSNNTKLHAPQLKHCGGTLTNLTCQSANLPQLKTIEGDFTIPNCTELSAPTLQQTKGSLTAGARHIKLPNLKNCQTNLQLPNAITLACPNLTHIGKNLEGPNLKELALPNLTSCQKIQTGAEQLILPQLTEAAVELSSPNAKTLLSPKLKTGGKLLLPQLQTLDLPALESSLHINCQQSVKINLPQIKKIQGYALFDNATRIEMSQIEGILQQLRIYKCKKLHLPCLQNIGEIESQNTEEVHLPNLKTCTGKLSLANTKRANLTKLKFIGGPLIAPNLQNAQLQNLENILGSLLIPLQLLPNNTIKTLKKTKNPQNLPFLSAEIEKRKKNLQELKKLQNTPSKT